MPETGTGRAPRVEIGALDVGRDRAKYLAMRRRLQRFELAVTGHDARAAAMPAACTACRISS